MNEDSANTPSALVTIVGLPPSMAATAEFVVPRSIPTTCEGVSESVRSMKRRHRALHTYFDRPSKLSAKEYLLGSHRDKVVLVMSSAILCLYQLCPRGAE